MESILTIMCGLVSSAGPSVLSAGGFRETLVSLPCAGTSDPYVKFKVGGRLMHKSRTIARDLNPVWDESFTLAIEDPFQPIQLKVTEP